MRPTICWAACCAWASRITGCRPGFWTVKSSTFWGSGIQVNTGQRLGRDFTPDDLIQSGYTAVFLGIGAPRSLPLSLAGDQPTEGVIDALDFYGA